ncbi:2-hydroxyacid dehydrogenase [Agrobacterium cavarae]
MKAAGRSDPQNRLEANSPLPPLLVVDRIPEEFGLALGKYFTLTTISKCENTANIRFAISGSDEADNLPINGSLLDMLPSLELLAGFGAGYDRIDVSAAARRGVVVTNTPNIHVDEVADFTIGLMIATVRQIPQADRFVRTGGWLKSSFPLGAGTLRGRRLGIAGLGAIGKAVASRAASFGMQIAYHGRNKQKSLPYPYYGSLEDLSGAVDVLIVTLPGGEVTRHLVNSNVLSALGQNGVLVNVSRGSVVDEDALILALREERILGAGLDVFSDEPRVRPEFLGFPNVVLQPHIGSATISTRRAMWQLVVDNLLSWASDGKAITPVPETSWPKVHSLTGNRLIREKG